MIETAPTQRKLSLAARALAGGLLLTLSAISSAGPVAAEGMAPPSEKDLEAKNPALYATAREFFPGDEQGYSAPRVFRLTRDQIDATVAAILPGYAPRSVKTAMPSDPLQTNYEYAEILNFNAANVRGYIDWVREIVAKVRTNPTRVIDCKTASNKADCVNGAARAFLLRTFRGADSKEKGVEIARIADAIAAKAGSGVAEQAAMLVELALTSPEFLFRKEAYTTSRLGRMKPEQLLETLSYMMADTPPETLKLSPEEAAGYFQTLDARLVTIDGILGSTPAREKLVRFFMAWLEVKEPAEFRISREVYPDFNDKLATAMVAETEQFLRAALAKPAPRLTDITQATQTFISKPLEAIYKSPAADARGSKAVDLDRAKRLGIFTHPAVLASHSATTGSGPIKRGVFWARKVMCMDLEPPPKGLDLTVYEMAGKTERERIEAVTKGAACIGCHKIIDPLGFFQESYDALGRFRDKDEHGNRIDSSMLPGFLGASVKKTETSVEALRTLTGSAMFKQCFVRQAFRFYMGRKEEPSDDPVLREMFVNFAHEDQLDILALLRGLAASNRISMRQ